MSDADYSRKWPPTKEQIEQSEQTFEERVRLAALAPTMRDALLKVKELREVEGQIRLAEVGSTARRDLLALGEKLETEINEVIEQVEQTGTGDLGPGTGGNG